VTSCSGIYSGAKSGVGFGYEYPDPSKPHRKNFRVKTTRCPGSYEYPLAQQAIEVVEAQRLFGYAPIAPTVGEIDKALFDAVMVARTELALIELHVELERKK